MDTVITLLYYLISRGRPGNKNTFTQGKMVCGTVAHNEWAYEDMKSTSIFLYKQSCKIMQRNKLKEQTVNYLCRDILI